MFTPDLAVAEYKTDWDLNIHQAKDPPNLEVRGSKTDWGKEDPQVEIPQALLLKEAGASAEKETTLLPATPRTTRIKKQDTGSQEEDDAKKRMKICLFHGVARKLTRLHDASAITQTANAGACPLM